MKRTTAVFAAMLLAVSCTGCGGSSTGNQTDTPSAQSSASADSSPAANTNSSAQASGVITDGSKCGVLQKCAEQDALTIKGLILTTGSGHHNYPSIADLIGKGYQTEGLYSEYYLNEWIEVYADCDQEVSLYVVKDKPERERDYAAMTETDLIKISGESHYPNIATGLTPNADENGNLTSFYVHPELGEGLYNMCFVSGDKICYLVQIRLTPEPTE